MGFRTKIGQNNSLKPLIQPDTYRIVKQYKEITESNTRGSRKWVLEG